MQATASELEAHVARMGMRPEGRGHSRRVEWERAFARLVELLRPRISHLIRTYGLTDIREDAEQVCAIGVLRALESYDAAKARFTTHVTWQMRGELQGLRHRMRLDQRQSARSAGVRTVSIEALKVRGEDGGADIFTIVDEKSLVRAERQASDHMVARMLDSLLDRLDAPDHERAIVEERIFGDGIAPATDRQAREQHRQIVRRTFRNCAKLLAA